MRQQNRPPGMTFSVPLPSVTFIACRICLRYSAGKCQKVSGVSRSVANFTSDLLYLTLSVSAGKSKAMLATDFISACHMPCRWPLVVASKDFGRDFRTFVSGSALQNPCNLHRPPGRSLSAPCARADWQWTALPRRMPGLRRSHFRRHRWASYSRGYPAHSADRTNTKSPRLRMSAYPNHCGRQAASPMSAFRPSVRVSVRTIPTARVLPPFAAQERTPPARRVARPCGRPER